MAKRVVVVGAGVMGLACALHLADGADDEVTVLDRRHPGAGSTGLSVGVYTRQYVRREDIEIRVEGVRQLIELEAAGAVNLRRIGLIRPSRDAETTARYEQAAAIERELGVADARVVDAEELRRLVPPFDASGIEAGLYCASDGYLDGLELCSALAERVQAAGVRLLARTAVQGLAPGRDARYVVRTDRGVFPADVVVNAAGAWAGQVGAALEAPVQVVNERHEAYVFELPPDLGYTIPMVLDYVPGSAAGEGLYFRHEGDRQLIAGMHSNERLGGDVADPDDWFAGATHHHVEALIERLAHALSGIEEIGYRTGWAGLYPHSPDGELVAGPHPANPDVLVGGGLGGNGLSVALALGAALAEWARFGELRTAAWAERLLPRPDVVAAPSGVAGADEAEGWV